MKIDVKICGLKTGEAMAAALDHGASHVGLIFFEKSPRHVTLQQASELRAMARDRAQVVAVTVNAEDATLAEIVRVVKPDMLQLHGSETTAHVRGLKRKFGLPVMKALAIRDAHDLDQVERYMNVADRLLFDAKAPKNAAVPGGRGVSFDWTLLSEIDPSIDYVLSGGLNALNIARALSIARPGGIDVSSGVETAPGEKSPQLIADFFEALRSVPGIETRQVAVQ